MVTNADDGIWDINGRIFALFWDIMAQYLDLQNGMYDFTTWYHHQQLHVVQFFRLLMTATCVQSDLSSWTAKCPDGLDYKQHITGSSTQHASSNMSQSPPAPDIGTLPLVIERFDPNR
jgi:hypothetical protein